MPVTYTYPILYLHTNWLGGIPHHLIYLFLLFLYVLSYRHDAKASTYFYAYLVGSNVVNPKSHPERYVGHFSGLGQDGNLVAFGK